MTANEFGTKHHSPADLSFQNLFLASLAQHEYNRISSHLRPISLSPGQRLCETRGADSSLYFLHSGLVSHQIESGLTPNSSLPFIVAIQGREGAICQPAYDSDSQTSSAVIVQTESRGWWIKAKTVRSELEDCHDLKHRIQQSVQSIQKQLVRSKTCREQHEDEERLAHWILSVCDRAGTDTVPVSDKVLAQMLDQPPSVVSLRVKTLQRFGLVEYGNNGLTITNRGGLINSACECYAPLFQQPDSPGA